MGYQDFYFKTMLILSPSTLFKGLEYEWFKTATVLPGDG